MALLDIRVGDKVFCIHNGWGVVFKFNGDSQFPIEVSFDNDKFIDSYNIMGALYEDFSPTLSFTEYTLEGFSQEKPEELPKPGDIVWVRDNEYDNWMITYFRKYEIDKKLKYGAHPRNSDDSNNIMYYQFMTTKNPYEK